MKSPTNRMRPIHPGEVLREEFLEPLDLSANRLAHALGVSANRITEIVAERRNLTADTALRLARFFDTTAEFWMNLQKTFELRSAEVALGGRLKTIKPLARKADRAGPPAAVRAGSAGKTARARKAQAARRLSNGRAPS